MARGKNKRKKGGSQKRDETLGPTPERKARNNFRSAGMAKRATPVIDVLRDREEITEEEWSRLSYYRDRANHAEKSPVRSCLDDTPPGGGHGPGASILSAKIETGRIERDMGELWNLARAVAVEDMTLSQWCIAKYGGRERYNDKGEFVAVVPICEKRHMALAMLELKFAASRINA